MIDRRKYKTAPLFTLFQELIEMELKEIEEYINEVSSDLSAKQTHLEKEYKKASASIKPDDDEGEYPYFHFENDINRYFKVFPVYTYNPLLLTLYGQFEVWLKKLCVIDFEKGLSQVKVSDLAGNNYIEKSRKYLTSVAGINLDKTTKEWKRITEIQKIRNCIAHNESNMRLDPSKSAAEQDLYNTLLNDDRIEFNLSLGDFYIKDKAFLIEVIQLVKTYITDIIKKLEKRKVIAKNTTMPFDNTDWGVEKSGLVLESIVTLLNTLDNKDYNNSDLKESARGTLRNMTHNVTKLLAFFSNGEWEFKDKELIFNEREEGLKKLLNIYKS